MSNQAWLAHKARYEYQLWDTAEKPALLHICRAFDTEDVPAMPMALFYAVYKYRRAFVEYVN